MNKMMDRITGNEVYLSRVNRILSEFKNQITKTELQHYDNNTFVIAEVEDADDDYLYVKVKWGYQVVRGGRTHTTSVEEVCEIPVTSLLSDDCWTPIMYEIVGTS